MGELRIETWTMLGADVGPETPPATVGARPGATRRDPAHYRGFPDEMLDSMAYGHVANHLPCAMRHRHTREKTQS